MKKTAFQSWSLIILLLSLITWAEPASARGKSHWTTLGALQVSDRVDRDVLHLKSRKGTFDSIRLKAIERAVQFHALKIHFENGTVQEVSLRTVIRPGDFSRVIDLKGGQRAIEKIVFVYDAQTLRPGKGAKVKVFGRR